MPSLRTCLTAAVFCCNAVSGVSDVSAVPAGAAGASPLSRLVRREAAQQVPISAHEHAVDVAGAFLEEHATSAAAADDISFFIRDLIKPPGVLEGYDKLLQGLVRHPSRVMDESKARFSVVAIRDQKPTNLDALPPRSAQRPYLAFGYDRSDNPDADRAMFARRKDILVVGYDLRSFYNNTGDIVPGVTYAPPFFFHGVPYRNGPGGGSKEGTHYDPDGKSQYFMTFRGDAKPGLFYTSHVRPDLRKAFDAYKERSDVVLEMVTEAGSAEAYSELFRDSKYGYEELFNSSYVLVPRGHGRWSYRLSETVLACAIPVVMADGSTLPYAELIDWSKASIRLPESMAAQPDAAKKILAALPSDPAAIRSMRKEVCRIGQEYFLTHEKRANAMLLSAAKKSDSA